MHNTIKGISEWRMVMCNRFFISVEPRCNIPKRLFHNMQVKPGYIIYSALPFHDYLYMNVYKFMIYYCCVLHANLLHKSRTSLQKSSKMSHVISPLYYLAAPGLEHAQNASSIEILKYRKTSNRRGTFGNKVADRSDVVGASPAATTSSLST